MAVQERAPRIVFTPSQEAMTLINEVAVLTKQTRSGVVSELVDEILPALNTMIQALRIAKEQPREAQRLMNNLAHRAVGEMTHQQLEFDSVLTGMEAQKALPLETTDGRTMKARRERARRGRTAQ